MKQTIVTIGIGEIGSVLARGFLRIGHPVYPVTRQSKLDELVNLINPVLVIIAVGEKDLDTTLTALPNQWRDRIVLIQNELLPSNWRHHELIDPTIISIWFEKKKGQDSKVLIPSPAFGPHSGLLKQALGSLDIPVNQLDNENDLLFELVVKNLYIVTTNVAGLKVGGNVGQLQNQHAALMHDVANEVLSIQETLTGSTFDNDALISAMQKAMDADPEHKCMGRSAPARLERALAQAAAANLAVPTLQGIADLS